MLQSDGFTNEDKKCSLGDIFYFNRFLIKSVMDSDARLVYYNAVANCYLRRKSVYNVSYASPSQESEASFLPLFQS